MTNPNSSGHLPVETPWRYKLASALTAPLDLRGIHVSGLENLPEGDESYILAANHRSVLDIPVLGRILLKHDGTQIHFVTKRELTDKPFVGKYMQKGGSIRFDRDCLSKDQPETLIAMNHVLQNGGVLGVLPEHTRRRGPELQVEKPGLGGLAARNSVKIVNVGLKGTENWTGPIYAHIGATTDPTEIIDGVVRRKRPTQIENEYTTSLQEAIYTAYELGGAGHLLPNHAQEGGL